jgi:hypothetical protein
MMIRSVVLVLLSLVLMVCGGLACTSKSVEPPGPTAHGYTFSTRVSDTALWLGPQYMGASRPNATDVLVEVRDMQGRRVEGVPVAFHVTPSGVQNATVLPHHTVTQNGIAHAVFKPQTIGVYYVMAQVNGQTQKKEIVVELHSYPASK